MKLLAGIAIFCIFQYAVPIEFSFEDFGVLSEGVRKRLAYSWEVDMEFTEAKEAIISETERRISTGEVSLKGRSNATELAEKVAESLSDLFSRRNKVVEKVVSYVEKRSMQFTWRNNIEPEDVPVMLMKDEFPVVRNINFGDDVNTSFSAVHIPIDIYHGSKPILNDMLWSQDMDAVFVDNYLKDSSVNWQYFASADGWLRQWPAKQCIRDPDLYDARMEPWYLEGLAAPKHLLILIDTSGSTKGMVMRFIKVVATSLVNMLADWDRVSVASFSEMVSWPSCAHRFLSATPLNKQLLSESIAQLQSKGQAQLEPALRFALEQFNDLSNSSSPNYDGYDTCNKFVAILTDGDETFDPEDFAEHYRNISTRIFVYGVGPTVTGTSALQTLAQKTNGEYTEILQMNAIRHTVQGYQPSLAIAKPAYNLSESVENFPPKVIGVAGADIRTPELVHTLNPILYDPAAYAFLVAHNGYIVYHSRHVPRKIGPADNKDPKIIAFTEVPIHVVDAEHAVVPLIFHDEYDNIAGAKPSDRKTSSLLYYGNKDYASEEKRWFAYTPIPNSSLGIVISVRENGVETLEPSEKLPLDFILRDMSFGEAPYHVDLRRLCGAASGIVSHHIARVRRPPPVKSTTSTTTSTQATTITDAGSGADEDDEEYEDLERFGADVLPFFTSTVSTVETTVTTTKPTTTTTPAPDYGLLYQEAATMFLQQYGNKGKVLKRYYCDETAVRHAGLDLILLRKLTNSIGHLREGTFANKSSKQTNKKLKSLFDDDEIALNELFVGEAVAWAVVFPSGVHYSSPPNGLSKACITDPHKLPAYQHAAYVRDQVFAQPAPCPEFSIVARSVHMRSMSLATIIVIYNSSSLLPPNCTNCMLFDDGGFLLAATNKTVARRIGKSLELLDFSLYNLLVTESNVYTTHSSRMLVRPCPPGSVGSSSQQYDEKIPLQESAGYSHMLASSLINKILSVSWWASSLSSFGKVIADATATVTSEDVPTEETAEELVIEDEDESEDDENIIGIDEGVEMDDEENFPYIILEPRTKCSRESLADDYGLPRKGSICAIRHTTLIPGPSFYISQLRPFACGHHCTRTAAWAPVKGTNLLFVVADPPCAGCANRSPTKHASGFSYETDALFDTCHLSGNTGTSVFNTHKYLEQPGQIDWTCSPLVFPPHSAASTVGQSGFYFLMIMAAFVVTTSKSRMILPSHLC